MGLIILLMLLIVCSAEAASIAGLDTITMAVGSAWCC
jgi:hypothetical protein